MNCVHLIFPPVYKIKIRSGGEDFCLPPPVWKYSGSNIMQNLWRHNSVWQQTGLERFTKFRIVKLFGKKLSFFIYFFHKKMHINMLIKMKIHARRDSAILQPTQNSTWNLDAWCARNKIILNEILKFVEIKVNLMIGVVFPIYIIIRGTDQ